MTILKAAFACLLLLTAAFVPIASAHTEKSRPNVPARCFLKIPKQKVFIGRKDCIKLFPARVMRGIVVTGLEESVFFEDATRPPRDIERASNAIWIDIDNCTNRKNAVLCAEIAAGRRTIYRIVFKGRLPDLTGAYGHHGMYDRGALLEDVISIRRIGP